tara:strand:- start:41497 stop:44166 length:2670 start_codon:yes stop_codon:yes gene_type:complete
MTFLHFRLFPILGLVTISFLACSPGEDSSSGSSSEGSTSSSATSIDVPIQIRDFYNAGSEKVPVRVSVPLPKGIAPEQPPSWELQIQGMPPIPVSNTVLSRWEDGSVRVALAEFMSPPIQPNTVLEGNLKTTTAKIKARNKWQVRNSALQTNFFQLALSDDALFSIKHADGSPWLGSIKSILNLDSQSVSSYSLHPGTFQLESDTDFSATYAKEDSFKTASGRTVCSLKTRITAWRNHSAVRVQQSLDIHSGIHKVQAWSLSVPLSDKQGSPIVALPDDGTKVLDGDFSLQQVSHKQWSTKGRTLDGRLPGFLALDDFCLSVTDFWQLYPSGFTRNSDSLEVEFCPVVDERPVVLEEGFGRTCEVWLDMQPTDPTTPVPVLTRRWAKPPLVSCKPEWYLSSKAFGDLGSFNSESFASMANPISHSIDSMLDRREKFARTDYGIQGFGDASGTGKTISYMGSMQAEYDPALTLFQYFLRTGDPKGFELGMDFAWHYADVDISPYGGAFQHRATRRHIETWIADLFSEKLEALIQSNRSGPLSKDDVVAWAEAQYEEDFGLTLKRWVREEKGNGADDEEMKSRVLRMLGMNEVILIERNLKGSEEVGDLRKLAEGISQDSRAQELGFTDLDTQFSGFFDLYGGSWDNPPVFNVDTYPIPEKRHMGGHSVIEGTVLAYLLSGEPRLKDSILRFAEHHADWIVPNAIRTLEEAREAGTTLAPRTIAWPVINILSIFHLTESRPNTSALHAKLTAAAGECESLLRTVSAEETKSSIHAGIGMEALSRWHEYSNDSDTQKALVAFAEKWAEDMYDQSKHAFRYHRNDSGEPAMSGLCIRGLAYAASISGNSSLKELCEESWEHLPEEVSMSKSFAMHYRGVIPTLHLMDRWASSP